MDKRCSTCDWYEDFQVGESDCPIYNSGRWKGN